jgi:hypothetical protein
MIGLTAAVLWLGLAAPVQAAEIERYAWDLALAGQAVGSRELTVKYRSDGVAEIRVLESWTELTVPLGRDDFTWTQRMSGLTRSGSGTFASVQSDDGWLREVQAVKKLQGWTVTVAEDGQARVYNLDRDAFDLTSLDLLDPGQGDRLKGRSELRVLAAETGTVIAGPLESLGATSVRIDGKAVAGTGYRWTTPDGPVELVYGPDGHLLRYALRVGVVTVSATLADPPEARRFEEELAGPLIGPAVQEEAL